jgi:uncharacterized protein (DUF736 family)
MMAAVGGFAGSIPVGSPAMADDIVFDSQTEPKPDQEEEQGANDRPVFQGLDGHCAAWLEQAENGTYYLSLQIETFMFGKQSVQLFPTEAKDMERLFQKMGTVASEK